MVRSEKNKLIYMWARLIFLLSLPLFLAVWRGNDVLDYMFLIFANTGMFFSLLLGAIFVAGLYVIIDRLVFFILHTLISRRLVCAAGECLENATVRNTFLHVARELRATSAEGVYTDDIIDHARELAMRDLLDGQEIDWGRSWLEFLGTIAPAVGFMGTLVGLIGSFRELGLGAELMRVLEGLALSMTTSLLGVTISVLFISSAWMLGRIRQTFDGDLYTTIASAQRTDQTTG